MSDFEEKNAEEKAEVAEDGWTAVKGKGTTRRTEEEQNEMKAKAAKKRKKGQLVSISKIKITGRLSFFVNWKNVRYADRLKHASHFIYSENSFLN